VRLRILLLPFSFFLLLGISLALPKETGFAGESSFQPFMFLRHKEPVSWIS
jgi:hypothetical protein